MSSFRILILSAPSGAGKTSLARALVETREDVGLTVSHTTRPRRPDEVEGKDYHFVSHDKFTQMIRDGLFVEYAQVFGNYYGTSLAAIQTLTDSGLIAILEIDWQGARRVRQKYPEAHSVFIMPPSRKALERRLRNRGQDSDAIIAKRMHEADSEMSHSHEYDTVVVNDDFKYALHSLNDILAGKYL